MTATGAVSNSDISDESITPVPMSYTNGTATTRSFDYLETGYNTSGVKASTSRTSVGTLSDGGNMAR